MEDMIALGGNISLVGFSRIDRASMAILKKMIGERVKSMSEFEKLHLALETAQGKHVIAGTLWVNSNQLVASSENKNLFFGVGEVLNILHEER